MKRDRQPQDRRLELFGQLLDGRLSEADKQELNALLKNDPDARQHYREHTRLHAQLHLAYAGQEIQTGMPLVREAQHPFATRPPATNRLFSNFWRLAAAASVAVGLVLALQSAGPNPVATLVSNENAAWVSSLPTAPNSRLMPGILELKAGMATVRFDSGALVTLEAPARLELINPMRGRMTLGAAIIEVPKPAIGFIMEAPNSYAVDHGTRFAMSVDTSGKESTFEVLSGEISVHHSVAKTESRLFQSQATTATERGLEKTDTPFSRETIPPALPVLRIGTGGKTMSIIRDNHLQGLNPRFLSVKSTTDTNAGSERRAFLSFDLSGVDLEAFGAAKMRLSLVPSGQGLAAQLPQEIRFQVYGIPQAPTLEWGSQWN